MDNELLNNKAKQLLENKTLLSTKNNELNQNPKDLIFLNNLINDSYPFLWFIGQFTVFKSINNILYLIYANKYNSIISYNIFDDKKINEIKNAHEAEINYLKYYLDSINYRDLIISLSTDENNIKVWNINDFELLLNIDNIFHYGYLNSACFLNNNNQIFIIACNHNNFGDELILVYDFKGNKEKQINNSNEETYYIEVYYDDNLSKNYILIGNEKGIKSFDYNENKIYHKYYEYKKESDHMDIIINKKNKVIELIDSCGDGNILIWDFHTALLLKKIEVCNKGLRKICKWNEEYIFVGCEDQSIKLVNLNNGEIIKELKCHKNKVLTIKSIFHPKYGKCLISQGANDANIKLWIIKS